MTAAPYTAVRNRRRLRQARLSDLGYATYSDYLRSAHWKRTREAYRDSAHPQDCICGESVGLQLHHLTYERVGAEDLMDLTWLCKNCHRMIHELERRGEVGLDFTGFANAQRAERYARQRREPPVPGNVDQERRRAFRSIMLRLKRAAEDWIAEGRDPSPILESLIVDLQRRSRI